MNINIRNGNVIDELKKIPDESVDCVVSSPPYYGLRDYSAVATYSASSVDEVIETANIDLQSHRGRVPEHQKYRYYLTDPLFDDKKKRWHVSLKYDVSEIWGGNPECEHEWIKYVRKGQEGGRNSDKLNIKKSNGQNFQIFEDQKQNICSKCGAWKGQLGLEPTYQMYGEHLMLVMKELKRVLKKTGTLFWNIGDSYSGSDSDISSKSLMMIPERFAMAMIDDGWILRNKLCWYKRNAMPSSTSDRLSNKWEYVFFFTKSQRYYFDLDSIRKPLAESSVKRISQENIPNQFQEGKSVEFAETDPVNNIPKILNNMHKKYNGVYSNLTPEESEKYGSPRARNMRANTGINNKEPYKQNNQHLMRLKENKEFFNKKGQGGNVDYNGIDSENGNHYNQNGANPGDVLFDDTIYDLYTEPSIQDAFMEYLERERPELLMSSILDISTRSHTFAHFAVFPETLVDPLIKAGCPSEVCVKCGNPKVLQHVRIEKTGNEKPISGKHATNPSVDSPGNREHYYTEVRKYEVDQRKIALFIKERLPKEKIPTLDDKFGETKWKHWIRTDESGASLPSPSEYAELKEILALPDDHDEEMLSTVAVLVDDSGNSKIPIGLKPSCNCNAGFKPGVVLDPFAGSGTVGVVAKEQGKNAILIEVSPEYLEIIKNRLEIKGSGTEINAGFVDVASIESMEEDE
jgi:DNA modification methylase